MKTCWTDKLTDNSLVEYELEDVERIGTSDGRIYVQYRYGEFTLHRTECGCDDADTEEEICSIPVALAVAWIDFFRKE